MNCLSAGNSPKWGFHHGVVHHENRRLPASLRRHVLVLEQDCQPQTPSHAPREVGVGLNLFNISLLLKLDLLFMHDGGKDCLAFLCSVKYILLKLVVPTCRGRWRVGSQC